MSTRWSDIQTGGACLVWGPRSPETGTHVQKSACPQGPVREQVSTAGAVVMGSQGFRSEVTCVPGHVVNVFLSLICGHAESVTASVLGHPPRLMVSTLAWFSSSLKAVRLQFTKHRPFEGHKMVGPFHR